MASYDHVFTELSADIVEFNESSLTEVWEKDFYVYGTTVYIGMEAKSLSGTIEVKWTVTDSEGTPKTDSNTTALTSWVSWTDDAQFEVDVSSLTTGSGTIKWEVNGNGQARGKYIVIYTA